MEAKTAPKTEVLEFPAFTYRGSDIPGLKMPAYLIDDLGTSREAHELAPKSIPLAWRVGLYQVGRDLSLGVEDTERLPEPVKNAARMVYQDAQEKKGRGGWHKDGVLYLQKSDAPKGMRQMPDPFVLAKYFKDIQGFKERGDDWEIIPSPNTREEYVWLPEGGGSFIGPTKDGAYHPVTGTFLETIKDKKEAIKRWVEAGLTEEQALKELSRAYRKSSGVAAVISWSLEDGGPLGVFLGDEPWGGSSDIGSFPASRSAERSEAPKNSMFRLLTREEYTSLLNDRKTLEAVRRAVK